MIPGEVTETFVLRSLRRYRHLGRNVEPPIATVPPTREISFHFDNLRQYTAGVRPYLTIDISIDFMHGVMMAKTVHMQSSDGVSAEVREEKRGFGYQGHDQIDRPSRVLHSTHVEQQFYSKITISLDTSAARERLVRDWSINSACLTNASSCQDARLMLNRAGPTPSN
jgi:hypothetical protein